MLNLNLEQTSKDIWSNPLNYSQVHCHSHFKDEVTEVST